MTERPRLAKSYELTGRELRIDGQQFPYLLHEDGPRIEPAVDSQFTILWVPVIVEQPCPQYGAPNIPDEEQP